MATKIMCSTAPFKERQKAVNIASLPDNCLAVVNPGLAAEWHPTKNGELTPEMVTKSSNKKVWWSCGKGHDWQDKVSHRSSNYGCPYCSGHRVWIGFNDLLTTDPKLASEWHPTKNGELTPETVTAGSGKNVWWQCKQGHEWQAAIYNRSKGIGCPYCSNKKAIKGFNDLKTVNPKLASEWHPTKNGDLTPAMVTKSSNKKVWWLGRCGHEWQAVVASRTNIGSGCPYCSGQKVLRGFNDLATVNPNLSAEWHPTKNGELTPDNVTVGSGKKVWWIDKYGHEWKAAIDNRSNGRGCPYCSGQKVFRGFNDLKTVNPKLASEWHPTKNGDLTPAMVTKSSTKKVWWRCRQGHEWQTAIYYRNEGTSCPICAKELQTSFPEQTIYYYVQKAFPDAINRDLSFGKELDIYIPSIHIAIEYDGSYFHKSVHKDKQKNEWCRKHGIRLFRIRECGCTDIDVGDVIVRKNGSDSSLEEAVTELLKSLGIQDLAINIDADRNDIYDNYVFSIKKNSIAVEYPNLATEWHPTKNGGLTPDMVTKNSNKKVWWLCRQGHEWQAVAASRTNIGSGCPYCSGHKVLKGFNDLATENSEIAAEWHPTKNGSLTPDMFTKNSGKKIWWLCGQGHEWQATIDHRNRDRGCPYCSGRKVLKGFNDLATVNPKLAAEWHPTKNRSLMPDMVTSGSKKNVWWQCKQGHEWQAAIYNRSKNKGCPYCSGRYAIKGVSDLATVNPELETEWHPTKNGVLTPDMVTKSANKKIWWQCKNGHEWQATINGRNNGSGCPYCAGKKVLKGFNDLATTNPKLAAEWHPTKNGDLMPDMVTKGSAKKAWWQCDKKHEWQAIIKNRNKSCGCPICYRQKRSSSSKKQVS